MTITRRLTHLLCLPLVALCACASTSVSEPKDLRSGGTTISVAARAERGTTRDLIVLSIDGKDVASATFDPSSSPVLGIELEHLGEPIEAKCSHRWRPGLHIGYRCMVSSKSGDSIELDF